MAFATPAWYAATERALAPAWPVMLGLALVVVAVTVFLVATRNRLALAAWLTYLYMP